MKKLFAILVVTVFAFAFAACKKDNANTTPDTPPTDDMAAPANNATPPAEDMPADAPAEDMPADAPADDAPAAE